MFNVKLVFLKCNLNKVIDNIGNLDIGQGIIFVIHYKYFKAKEKEDYEHTRKDRER